MNLMVTADRGQAISLEHEGEPSAPLCLAVSRLGSVRPATGTFTLWVQLRGRSWIESKEGKFRLRAGDWIAFDRDSRPTVQADRNGLAIGVGLDGAGLQALAELTDSALYPGRSQLGRGDLRIALRLWRNAARSGDTAGARPMLLHLAATDYPGRRANNLGQPHWNAMFAGLEGAAERLKPGLAATIDADLADFAEHWPADLPTGTIHADFFPDNVFFKEGRFAAAIDFYFACDDALAYDIGVCLNAWCFEPDGSFNVTSARNLLAGYEAVRPLNAGERAALPLLARGAAMRFFLTRLADWESTPAGALVKPHDPLEYERKLAVHRAGVALLPEPS